jgi:hypothetical protein
VTRKPRVAKPELPVRQKRPAPQKRPARQKRASPAAVADPAAEPIFEIEVSNLLLHELFEQQAAEMLERVDLDEDQRQSILLAMGCPCCSGGGPSFSFKLKRRT